MGSLFKKSNDKSNSGVEDPFDLVDLIDECDLEDHQDEILSAVLPTVLLELAKFDANATGTESRLLGSPTLPAAQKWPRAESGGPMVFLGQLRAEDLAKQESSELPETGLFSVFIDTLDDDPTEASVLHFSDLGSLELREPEHDDSKGKGYFLKFGRMASLPKRIKGIDQEDYTDFLDEIEDRQDTATCLRYLGHSPTGETRPGQFFLSLHDIEELGVAWSPSGVASLRLEKSGDGFKTHLFFIIEDEDDDEDDDDD